MLFGSVRIASAEVQSVWFGSARIGSARVGSDRLGLIRLESVRLDHGSARSWFGSINITSVSCASQHFSVLSIGHCPCCWPPRESKSRCRYPRLGKICSSGFDFGGRCVSGSLKKCRYHRLGKSEKVKNAVRAVVVRRTSLSHCEYTTPQSLSIGKGRLCSRWHPGLPFGARVVN